MEILKVLLALALAILGLGFRAYVGTFPRR